ncbi:MAG: HAD family hydrolase [Bdellovibrionaceae bacterium]|nr:HAD family hydrolase [Pseudobdellovibrionaceae bacterium]|tara:strand:- start:176 stop:958 length:783 start_codon:yes stop_codon:yes gene_type:complete
MQPIEKWISSSIKSIFCDIDDTLTNDGKLRPEAYQALWDLFDAGYNIIPITGRPAGWCEMIARFWPVHGVIGENGGLYFRHNKNHMKRAYKKSEDELREDNIKLQQIKADVLKAVPDSAVASDQFCRQIDLAIDFAEDVGPLSKSSIQKIVDIFHHHGATAKVSSIHVNGWFGQHNKLSMCEQYCRDELGQDMTRLQDSICFVGDSPNDEPMFGYFENSIGVANVMEFKDDLKSPPKFVTNNKGGFGFVEVAHQILGSQN